mmetsp:Transcript_34578/g.97517  ORF Transcript_34578/g.97517 Transcript_34578/m.97517 type:complete len:204 (-) Transcript_34578:560-1171(-)
MLAANRAAWRCSPRMDPLRNTREAPGWWSSWAVTKPMGSQPREKASLDRPSSSSSVVTCVISARFLTRPQLSPSGVSLGHSMPHCEGCRARGPLTFLVFSNCDVMRVIIPRAEMKDSRESTWVTPLRSMRNRFTVQFPLAMACSSPVEMMSFRKHLTMSNCDARLALARAASVCRLRSALSRLKRSSNSRDSSWPASSRRLLP